MKRFFCIFLVMLPFLIGSIVVLAAPGENLVTNPGFENGIQGWIKQGTVNFVVSDKEKVSGNYSCLVTGRGEAYASPVQDITSLMLEWGPGDYIIGADMKIADSTASATALSCLQATIDGETKWFTPSGTINNKTFTRVEGTLKVTWKTGLSAVLFTINSQTLCDIYVDNMTIRKADGIKTPVVIIPADPLPPVKIVNRSSKTLVGAIRWDAWLNPALKTFGSTDPKTYVGAQVCNTLGPKIYHFRLPYFGIVQSPFKVTFPDYTQKIFDQEMVYAKQAGIDYFMYCWYDDGSGMDLARKYHAASKYRNDVKMTAAWDVSSSSRNKIYIENIKNSYWQMIDGDRPLVYISNGTNCDVFMVNGFRKACMDAGLKNPYLIGLRTFGFTSSNIKSYGIDAISDYVIGGQSGEPYADLIDSGEQQWNSDRGMDVQVVPCVTAGWDPRPRIDNPTTWGLYGANHFAETAKPEEIATFLSKALSWNKANAACTPANTILIYAWNEHDEGGWLCPTIIDDDADGLPELRPDGTNKRDTRRLQAIQKVLRPGVSWTLDKDILLGSGNSASSSASASASNPANSGVSSSTTAYSTVSGSSASISGISSNHASADDSNATASGVSDESSNVVSGSSIDSSSANSANGADKDKPASNVVLIVIIIAAILLSAGAGYYFLYYKKNRIQ
ncbi:MAG: carbohydrate binding domain-containing protein [Saccharofermentanales bacterium]